MRDGIQRLREKLEAERRKAREARAHTVDTGAKDLTWCKVVWVGLQISLLCMAVLTVLGLVVGIPCWFLYQLFTMLP